MPGPGWDDPLCIGLCRCLVGVPNKDETHFSSGKQQSSESQRFASCLLCEFTHHMNPFSLSCQFPKLVRTKVDEGL